MTNQHTHRATPEQWEYQERWASDDDDASCILELRCRIESLEAAQRESPMTELRAASAEVRPTVKDSLTDGGSLVERVALTRMNPPLDEDDLKYARAAIREVAKWLREQGTPASGWAMRLEQEADRG
jgi:hypothetical protein